MSSLVLEQLDSVPALEELVPEWRHLWERCPSATVFQSPEWLLPWWRYVGGGTLRVLALRADGNLVGLAPLFLHIWQGQRQISPVGVSHSDYINFLLLPELARQGLLSVWRHLADLQAEWDLCDLPDIPPDSPLLRVPVPKPLQAHLEPGEVCPVVELTSAEAFWKNLPAHYRRNLRRARRILETTGAVHIERADRDTVPEFLDVLFRLHEKRWAEKGERGVLADANLQAFHRQAAGCLQERGLLRLYGLFHDHALSGVMYDLAAGQRVYAYLDGFDPELERGSPGVLLTLFAIQEAIREGRHEYDLLRGKEEHKYMWGARDRQNYHLLIRHSASPEPALRNGDA